MSTPRIPQINKTAIFWLLLSAMFLSDIITMRPIRANSLISALAKVPTPGEEALSLIHAIGIDYHICICLSPGLIL